MSDEKPKHANLASAILALMEDVGYVQKTGKVDMGRAGGYKFAGEAAMLAALRPAMIRHGLVMLPVGLDLREHHEMVETKYGPKPSRTVRVVSTYRLMHESGEHLDVMAAGEGQDSGDKATSKAMTIALKYALRQSFLIETGDDPDETRPEREYEDEPRRAPAKRRDEVPEYSEQHVINMLTETFGDGRDEANRADAEMMVKEATGFDIAGMLKSRTAREVVVNALRANARRGK